MTAENLRTISLTRNALGSYEAVNGRGGKLPFGDGNSEEFTPVELLLAAMAGCSAIDVDYLTSRLAEPTGFQVSGAGEKISDEQGNHLGEITITFDIQFPADEAGDRARTRLPDAVARSRDRLCTVSRTVQLSAPVTYVTR